MRSARQSLADLNTLLVKHSLPRVKHYPEIAPLLLVALFESMQSARLPLLQRAGATRSQQIGQIDCLVSTIGDSIMKLPIRLLDSTAIVDREDPALQQLIHVLLLADQVLMLPIALASNSMVSDSADADTTSASEWISDNEESVVVAPAPRQRRPRRSKSVKTRAARDVPAPQRRNLVRPVDLGDLYHLLKAHCSPDPSPKQAAVQPQQPVPAPPAIETPDFARYRAPALQHALPRHVHSPRHVVSPLRRSAVSRSAKFNRFKRSLGTFLGEQSVSMTPPKSQLQSLRQSMRSTAGDSDAVFYQDEST